MMLVGNIHADPLGLLIAFGGGMLSFLSPCVLPLVPGYLSMVSGLSAAELDSLRPSPPVSAVGGSTVMAPLASASGGRVSAVSVTTTAEPVADPTSTQLRSERGRLLRGILLFIAGFTVVFTILGASASAVGHAFHTHLPELTRLSGFLIVAFGLILVAMASGIRLPTAVTGERRFLIRPSLLGAWAPPVMGAAFAFAWTPCVGPILASVLALAAGTGGTTTGGIALLLAYSLGLGVPFLLFIAGFTVVFTILGASASAVGHAFHTHLPELTRVSGFLIVAFGLILVAVASGIRLPTAVTGERRFLIRPSLLGAWAPPVMGAAFAFAWTPCIGPILASVLTLAAGTGGTTAGGIALLLAYSLGLGVPFLLFGLAFGRMTDLLARFRGRLRLVDLVGGVILVTFGILLVTGNVDVISVHISNWLHDLHLGRLATS